MARRIERRIEHRFLRWIVTVGFLGFAAVSVASFLGGVWPDLDLFSHFRTQFTAAAAVFLVLLLVCRRYVYTVAALAVGLAHALPLLPYVLPHTAAVPCPGGTPLRLIALNLHHRHGDIAAVEALIRAERPDVVLVTEYLPAQAAVLANLRDHLPHVARPTRRGTFQVMLLSRRPIAEYIFHRPDPGAPFLPLLSARLCPSGGRYGDCVTVVGLHASQPMMGDDGGQRRGLRFAAGLAAGQRDGRVIVAGDLNTTPWAARFGDLLARGGLRDSAVGEPFRATWLSSFPLFGLPIDHVLVGRGIQVRTRRLGHDIGSDHRPVIADLAVCPARRRATAAGG